MHSDGGRGARRASLMLVILSTLLVFVCTGAAVAQWLPGDPSAISDTYYTPPNVTLVVEASGVLANDVKPENSALTAALVHTTLHGTISLQPNGSFDYDPDEGFVGTDVFTYTASALGKTSNISSVAIVVAPPVQPRGFVSVACGSNFTIGLKSDGTVWAWGCNDYAQLGKGDKLSRETPSKLAGLSGVVAVAAGQEHAAALKGDGTVWTWGFAINGMLGRTGNNSIPAQVPGLTDVIAISAGANHTMVLKRDGTVWTWGQNDVGQLGNGAAGWQTASQMLYSSVPAQVPGLSGVQAISAGYYYCVALKNTGEIVSWGDDSLGQIGDGRLLLSRVPGPVSSTPDTTPPPPPVVAADAYTTPDHLHANWFSNDPDSGVESYMVAIGTSPSPSGGSYLVDWTELGLMTDASATDIALPVGSTYYWYVRARNGMGVWGDVGVSNASVVMPVRYGADDTTAAVNAAIVSAVFSDGWYVESEDRSWGTRVTGVSAPALYRKVSVLGTVKTLLSGERYIAATSWWDYGASLVTPVGLSCGSVGGSSWQRDGETSKGQEGVTGGSGLNNIGLLIRITGAITRVDDHTFTVDDWSSSPVRCVLPDNVTVDPAWRNGGVTGLSSCENTGGAVTPLVRVRSRDDITTF